MDPAVLRASASMAPRRRPFGAAIGPVSLRYRCRRLQGWRRHCIAAAAGALAVAAMPPVHAVPALIPALVILYWLTESARTPARAALVGLSFGLGFFTAGLYWVANALLTKPETFGWLAPIAPVGLALLLAPFIAVAAAATRAIAARGLIGILVFAAAWTLAEWLRSWVATGFPWNLMGSVWVAWTPMIQVAAVVGTYGLGFLTVVACAMPACLGDASVAPPRRRLAAVAVAWAVLAAVWLGGALRLDAAGPAAVVDGVWLRLVQPNIAQTLKWQPELADQHLLQHLRLQAQAAARPPTIVVWSEAAVPFFLSGEAERLKVIGDFTPVGGLTITGAPRRSPPGEPLHLWNSLYVINDRGEVVATYDKSHLVPFGEYMPFRTITGLAKVTEGMVDFSPGPGVTTLRLPGVPPLGPLICYEVIFPAGVVDADERPAWMLNITNDGWYGLSAGPYQHLAAARLRAVEEGLPLVRVANTGISAIIDSHGRIAAYRRLGEAGVVDGPLPAALAAPTLYGRCGNLPILLALCGLLVVGALRRRR